MKTSDQDKFKECLKEAKKMLIKKYGRIKYMLYELEFSNEHIHLARHLYYKQRNKERGHE